MDVGVIWFFITCGFMISLTRSLCSLVRDIIKPLVIKTISHPQPLCNLFITCICNQRKGNRPFQKVPDHTATQKKIWSFPYVYIIMAAFAIVGVLYIPPNNRTSHALTIVGHV